MKVAILTNELRPDRQALFAALCPVLEEVRIFLSDRVAAGYGAHFGENAVTIKQSGLHWTWVFRNVSGFCDQSDIQIPYDTFFRLFSYRPQVVISGELGFRTAMSVLYKIVFPRTLLIVWATLSVRTESTRGWVRHLLRRWILAHTDAAFVNGRSGERYLRDMGYDGNTYLTPYTVNDTLFQPEYHIPEDGVIRLFYVGQLIERKGLVPFLTLLLRWCREHSGLRVNLRIAGVGPEFGRLSSMSLPANLIVEFLNKVPHVDLVPEYQNATFFVFPTLADEWGLVVAEALSCGLPVLGSIYSQAVEELVVDGVNGWTFVPEDERGVYEVLDTAFRTGDRAQRALSINARTSIARVTPNVLAATIKEAIDEEMRRKTADVCAS